MLCILRVLFFPYGRPARTDPASAAGGLRFTSIDGEDYGRGFVEEYRGDLTSFEQMSRDVLFASANASKVVWAIDPASGLKVKKFNDTPNGGAIAAKGEDIEAIRLVRSPSATAPAGASSVPPGPRSERSSTTRPTNAG